MTKPHTAVASFDLFDTLIARTTIGRSSLHRRVARALDMDEERYVSARFEADAHAVRLTVAPTLDGIHDQLAALLDLDRATSRKTRRLETELDLGDLYAIPESVRLLRRWREREAHIVFISDMHFGAALLGPRLTELGIMTAEDTLVVSCDHGVSKATKGELFPKALEILDCRADQVVHHGDDRWADRAMARRHGIRSVFEQPAALNRYERSLIAADDPTELAQLLAGISRRLRLEAVADGDDEAMAAVVCGVAAPTMIAFALWLALEASQSDLERLIFLSRNGRLPYEVFGRLGNDVSHGIDADYLRLSRDAVRLPSAAAIGLDRWIDIGHAGEGSFITEFGDRLTVRQLVVKLGLDSEVDGSDFERHGLDLDQPLSAQAPTLWRRALDDEVVRGRLQVLAGEAHVLITDYFVAHGLDAHERVGMVDIGWTGQQSAMVSACLSGVVDVHHLHLGRLRGVELLAPTMIRRFLFDEGQSPVNNPIGLYELFTATSEPGMRGVERTPDGSVEPEDRSGDDDTTASPLVEPLHRLTLAMADLVRTLLHECHLTADLRPTLHVLAQQFWFEPTPAEGRYFGALPWEVDSSGFVVRTFSAPIGGRELLRVLRPGGLVGRQWTPGAVAASARPIRWLLMHAIRRRSRRQLEAMNRESIGRDT